MKTDAAWAEASRAPVRLCGQEAEEYEEQNEGNKRMAESDRKPIPSLHKAYRTKTWRKPLICPDISGRSTDLCRHVTEEKLIWYLLRNPPHMDNDQSQASPYFYSTKAARI
ncbi:hypothetical protein OUZ56_004249 [Daphnia magna]|uniref:Uncharacterized protein n=1 Tax=Daphnia magna TaxID=35525 RepID=A0ABQ9YP94_9CRUS|nr:hypothetical protein OUZ56_004249 [Daphnia magna]